MDAPTLDTPTQPGEKQVFLLLRKLGLEEADAFDLVQGMQNMAGQNLIAEMRVQNAKLDAQNAKLDAQRWFIGLGFTVLAILITVLALLAKS